MRGRWRGLGAATAAVAAVAAAAALIATLPFRPPGPERARPSASFVPPPTSFGQEALLRGVRLRGRTAGARIVRGRGTLRPARRAHLLTELESDTPKTRIAVAARVRRGPPAVRASRFQSVAPREQAAQAAGPHVELFRNTDLAAGSAIRIAEPSVASNGRMVLETWNFNAAVSSDAGATFRFLDPARVFPRIYGGFCCDQVAYYVPQRNLYVWVLQYWPNRAGTNAIRIAVANGAGNLAAARFRFWDLTPRAVGDSAGTSFDQPKVSHTNRHLFIAVSRYTTDGQGLGSVVLRIPLAELAGAAPLTFDVYRPRLFSPALVTGATDTMYFATHLDTSTLRVYRWPDGAGAGGVTFGDVHHSAYPRARVENDCARAGAGAASNWCGRSDDRINGGWLADGVLGWAWNASAGIGGLGAFRYPYVHVVRVDRPTLELIDEPALWSSTYAFQYPAIAGNAAGDLGGVVMWGGGTAFESCGVVRHSAGAQPFWTVAPADVSDADPDRGEGGDFSTVRVDAANPDLWSAGCYALRGGGSADHVHVYYVAFGRPGAKPPVPGAGVPPSPTDTHAPLVHALPSAGRRGRPVKLFYRVSDDSGQTREVVRVLRGRAVVATRSTSVRAASASYVYYVTWHAPSRAGRLRFCVRAFDAAGHRGGPSCAPLGLR